MAEISVNINGRKYGMECDDGQESRVVDLGQYVDHKVKQIAAAGAATGESHLLVLTSLMLADEILELKSMWPMGMRLRARHPLRKMKP